MRGNNCFIWWGNRGRRGKLWGSAPNPARGVAPSTPTKAGPWMPFIGSGRKGGRPWRFNVRVGPLSSLIHESRSRGRAPGGFEGRSPRGVWGRAPRLSLLPRLPRQMVRLLSCGPVPTRGDPTRYPAPSRYGSASPPTAGPHRMPRSPEPYPAGYARKPR